MLLFNRPLEPPNFAKQVARHRQLVQQHVDALRGLNESSSTRKSDAMPPVSEKGRSRKKTKEIFVSKWSNFKDAFSKAQYGKCAYCEVSVIGAQAGDVEHYYPKAQVQALHDDPDTWGKEKPYLSNVEGRRTKVLCESGYWWLAYEWSNYLLACAVCNQYWKGAIFPVENDPRTLPPAADKEEVALLLNPYEDVDPAEHLSFDKFGNICSVAGSRRGFELIRTCGLHRPSLRNIRGGIATDIFEETNRLGSVERHEQLREVLYSLYLKGVETNRHAGMVRIIVEQRIGLTWTDVMEQLARLLISELLDASTFNDRREFLMPLYEMGNESCENAQLVHTLVAQRRGIGWESLVRELATGLARLLNTPIAESIEASVKSYLYEMGKHGPSALKIVTDSIGHECGLGWEMLEADVALSRNWAGAG